MFTTFYVLEVLAKVLVNGWKKYTESARNVFDFFITCLSVLATIYVYCELVCVLEQCFIEYYATDDI